MNEYVGMWIHPKDLGRDIEVGDIVIIETFGDSLVVEVDHIDWADKLYHYNNWIIPRHQILAVKSSVDN